MTRRQAIDSEAQSPEPEAHTASADSLVAGFDTPEGIEEAWAEEIERRSATFRSGAAPGLPAEAVLAEGRTLVR